MSTVSLLHHEPVIAHFSSTLDDEKNSQPRVLNRMSTRESGESLITTPPFSQTLPDSNKIASPLTPPASDDDSSGFDHEKRNKRASKGLSLSRSMHNLKVKVGGGGGGGGGGSGGNKDASGRMDKRSRERANTTTSPKQTSENIPPVPPVPAMPTSLAAAKSAITSSSGSPTLITTATKSQPKSSSGGFGSFFRRLAGKSPAPSDRTPRSTSTTTSATKSAVPTQPTPRPANIRSGSTPVAPSASAFASKKSLHLKISTQSLGNSYSAASNEPVMSSARSEPLVPSLPQFLASPSESTGAGSLAPSIDVTEVKRASTVSGRRVPAPHVVTDPCEIPLPRSPSFGSIQLPPSSSPDQPSIAVFAPESTCLPLVSPPKPQPIEPPTRLPPVSPSLPPAVPANNSLNRAKRQTALLSFEGFDIENDVAGEGEEKDIVRPLAPLRIPSNSTRNNSDPSPVTATEDDIVTPSSSVEDRATLPRAQANPPIPTKVPYASAYQPQPAPTTTPKLTRTESKWRKSVMNLSEKQPFNRRMSQQAQLPPPVVYESYVAKQRRMAANRVSCAPTQHSRASVAAELQQMPDKEAENMEAFFMA